MDIIAVGSMDDVCEKHCVIRCEKHCVNCVKNLCHYLYFPESFSKSFFHFLFSLKLKDCKSLRKKHVA